MKVLLVKMPFFEQEYVKFSEKWEHIEDEYIGIGIVGQILKDYSVDVVLSSSCSVEDMLIETLKNNPDVVMISVMQTSARLAYKYIYELRNNGYCGKVFVGGWFAKMAWQEIFVHNWPIDYVCYLDAEVTLPSWIKNPKSNIVGIATYQNWMQQRFLTKQQLRKLHLWPNNYVSPLRTEGRKTYSLETSRGCPHSACTFCSQSCGNYVMNKWMPLPIETLKNEIMKLHNKYGATRFATSDDDMLGPMEIARNRVKDLQSMFQSLPFRPTFSAAISVKAACDEEIIDRMLEAGMEQLCIGFESADEVQLKRYNKFQTLKDNYIAAEILTRKEIKLLPGLITFDPYSTKDTVAKNLSFLFDHLHHYDLAKLTKKLHLLTGTSMVKRCDKDGILTGDYLYYDYIFKEESVRDLFMLLQEYTSMVQNIQKKINVKGQKYQQLAGDYHKKVVDYIISGHSDKATLLSYKNKLEKILVL